MRKGSHGGDGVGMQLQHEQAVFIYDAQKEIRKGWNQARLKKGKKESHLALFKWS